MASRSVLLLSLLFAVVSTWCAGPMETVDVLDSFCSTDAGTAWRVSPEYQARAEQPDFDDSSWSQRDLSRLVGVSAPFWVRKTLVIPDHVAGVPLVGGPAWLSIDCGGYVRVYVDGRPVQDLEPGDVLVPLTERAYPGREIVIAMRVQHAVGPVVFRSVDLVLDEIQNLRGIARGLLGDLQNALLLLRLTRGGTESEYRRRFLEAVRAIDLDALYARDEEGLAVSAARAKQILASLRALSKEMNVYATGRALLDPFGKQTKQELVAESRASAQEVLDLLNRYPDLVIVGWDAMSHRWLEEQEPSLHRELVKMAVEHRYVLAGGAWTHFDPDLVSGETIIRQYKYGKDYFERVFGQQVRIATFPGVPSAGPMLPEFLSGCGMTGVVFDSFEGSFPWNLFLWRSESGAQILSYYSPHRSESTPGQGILPALESVHNRHGLRDVGILFDVTGDRKSSGEEMIRFLERADRRPLFPTTIYTDLESFFDRLVSNPYGVRYPSYTGPVTLARHPQRFIQVPLIKRLVGQVEALLLDLERIQSVLFRLAAEPFPREDLDEQWRQLLSFQRRAVLAGVADQDVLNEAREGLGQLRVDLESRCQSALLRLAGEIETLDTPHAVMVYNPLSWIRSDAVTVPIPFEGKPVSVKNHWRETVPSQVVNGGREVCFLAENVPPLGYKLFHLIPKPADDAPATVLKVKDETVLTEHFRFTVNTATGRLSELRLAETGEKILGPEDGFGLGLLWEDLPETGDVNVEVLENGPVRARIRATLDLGSSSVVQDYEAVTGRPRVHVAVSCNGASRSLALRAQSGFFGPSVVYAVAGAVHQRKTVTGLKINGPVPGQDWAVMVSPDESFGFGLLTDSRTGYLFGPHELTCALRPSERRTDVNAALYPFQGNWHSAKVYRQAQELRHPLLVVQTDGHAGRLRAMDSLVQVVTDDLTVGSVRATQGRNGLILRLWEMDGVSCRAEIQVGSPVLGAEELTLLDDGPLPLEYAGQTVFVPFEPFQVKTVRVFY